MVRAQFAEPTHNIWGLCISFSRVGARYRAFGAVHCCTARVILGRSRTIWDVEKISSGCRLLLSVGRQKGIEVLRQDQAPFADLHGLQVPLCNLLVEGRPADL